MPDYKKIPLSASLESSDSDDRDYSPESSQSLEPSQDAQTPRQGSQVGSQSSQEIF